eukprot:1137061-Pelagomonas_calceolata.AAC.10
MMGRNQVNCEGAHATVSMPFAAIQRKRAASRAAQPPSRRWRSSLSCHSLMRSVHSSSAHPPAFQPQRAVRHFQTAQGISNFHSCTPSKEKGTQPPMPSERLCHAGSIGQQSARTYEA